MTLDPAQKLSRARETIQAPKRKSRSGIPNKARLPGAPGRDDWPFSREDTACPAKPLLSNGCRRPNVCTREPLPSVEPTNCGCAVKTSSQDTLLRMKPASLLTRFLISKNVVADGKGMARAGGIAKQHSDVCLP